MTKLTQEQLQTIEDAFNSIPEHLKNWHTTSHKGVVLPYNTLIDKKLL